ncbi:MAG: hypothetical protein R2698_12510 [Microthrixaceae bacterium]
MLAIALKSLRANLPRLVATLVAIAVGVGFLTAGTMLTDSISNSLGGEVDTVLSGVDVVVTTRSISQGGTVGEIDPAVLTEVEKVPGVTAVSGRDQRHRPPAGPHRSRRGCGLRRNLGFPRGSRVE